MDGDVSFHPCDDPTVGGEDTDIGSSVDTDIAQLEIASMSDDGEMSPQRDAVRLLVVDDDPFIRTSLGIMLETIGLEIRVDFCDSGKQAYDMLTARNYHLALIDIHLPDISGTDLSWCYNESNSQEGWVPTILIACTADESVAPELVSSGMHDLLAKPFTLRALRHILHKWLSHVTWDEALIPRGLSLTRSASTQTVSQTWPRVLLVEDDPVTMTTTQLLLEQLGCLVSACENGTAAKGLLCKQDFELVVLDVHLPDMSGYALSSWYRELAGQQVGSRRLCGHVGSIVAVTCDPDREACRDFGIDMCLPKPLSTGRCVEALRLWKHKSVRPGANACAADASGESSDAQIRSQKRLRQGTMPHQAAV